MPLMPLQAELLAILAPHRSDASYFAGGAALHLGAEGERFSNDLNFFHSTAHLANQAFATDASTLRAAGHDVEVVAEHRGALGGVVAQAADMTIG